MDEGLVLPAAPHADGVGIPLAHPDPELPELLLTQDPRSVLVEGVNILQKINKSIRGVFRSINYIINLQSIHPCLIGRCWQPDIGFLLNGGLGVSPAPDDHQVTLVAVVAGGEQDVGVPPALHLKL